MMQIAVVSIFPALVRDALMHGVVGRALRERALQVHCIDPRDYTQDAHRSVDDRPFGGGPGMVMKFEPLRAALRAAAAWAPPRSPRIYLNADGERFDQGKAKQSAACAGLVLLAGRYEGIDDRLLASEIDGSWSIGDYVLSGGELPALVVIDAIARLLPGVLGCADSAQQESFSDGLLDWPHFTRPDVVAGMSVPAVLASGDHAAIRRWRLREAVGRTWLRRPDLLSRRDLSAEERQLLEEFKAERRQGADVTG